MFAAPSAPRVVLTIAAGALVDRWDRWRTMVAADVVRAALLLPLLALDWTNHLWLVYAVTAAQTAADASSRLPAPHCCRCSYRVPSGSPPTC
jgi:hypothetical protein